MGREYSVRFTLRDGQTRRSSETDRGSFSSREETEVSTGSWYYRDSPPSDRVSGLTLPEYPVLSRISKVPEVTGRVSCLVQGPF